MTDLADHLIEQKKKRDTRIRQGKVISIQAGPPRTLTVEIGGTNYTKISCMAHVDPVVNENVWMMDIGQGRWIAFGATSNSLTRTNFVKLSGDSMTGSLATSGDFQLASGNALTLNGANNRIYYFNSGAASPWMDGPRLIGNSGWSFYAITQSKDTMGYRATTPYYAWVSDNMLVGSTPDDAKVTGKLNVNGALHMVGNNDIYWPSWGGGWYMLDASWMRVTNNKNIYTAGEIRAAAGFSTNTSTVIDSSSNVQGASTVTAPLVRGTNQGNAWNNCAILANVGNNTSAGLAMHPGTYAPVIGATTATGNNQYFRDGSFSGNSSGCYSAGWGSDSSIRWKKNIARWPAVAGGAAVQGALDQLMRLQPISYQVAHVLRPVVGSLRRAKALERLNAYKTTKGDPLYEIAEHNCETDDCDGSADDPCIPRRNHDKVKLGLIAEEVVEIFPEAISLDVERKPEAIEYAQLTVVTIAALQELTRRVEALEGAN